jgi:hypothetical protein
MTPQELMDLCRAPIEGAGGAPVMPDHIYLVIPKRGRPGARFCQASRQGPLGRVCVARADKDLIAVVAVFERAAVVAFLARMVRAGDLA